MTHQRRLHLERTQRFESQVQALNQERETVSVGLGKGIVGITVRDRNLRTIHQILDLSKIDSLIEQLKMARLHLEFAETVNQVLLKS